MKVSHYFEWERWITGGHAQTVRNQRKVLEANGIDYTTEPDLDADLLHLNNMGPRSVAWALRARRRDVPVVVHTHNTAEDFRESFALSNYLARPMRPYLEFAYSLADHQICPSAYNREVIAEYDPETPKTVVSNGFDAERLAGFESLRTETLERYDLDPPVVFDVGHVIERKGLRDFVATARRMPEVDFAWFGYVNPTGGPLGRFLTSRTVESVIESAPENCTFTGYVEDPRAMFAAGDVFFWPSKNENEGMALLEAMACEKAPVVRDLPVYEWLDDGADCLKADGVDGFVAAIEELLDAERRRAVGAAAAKRSEDFTLESVGEDLLAVYRSVLG